MQFKYIKTLIFLFSCLFYVSFIHAQECEHGHIHLRNEAGFGSGAVYSFGHKTWGAGMHLHCFHTLGPHSRWSLGGSIEQVWNEDSHFNIGAAVKYQISYSWSFGIAPGVTFFSHNETEANHETAKTRFTMHFETIYDILHWDLFHLGLALDCSLTKGDSHAALGIHAAYCF
jgi:hypothetical protein